jgi:hypothetical protein
MTFASHVHCQPDVLPGPSHQHLAVSTNSWLLSITPEAPVCEKSSTGLVVKIDEFYLMEKYQARDASQKRYAFRGENNRWARSEGGTRI